MTHLANKPVVLLLKAYKAGVSPFLPPACRFQPTCSVYAVECFQHLGFFRATWLTIRRLGRCHPFHPGGFDPAPVPNKERPDISVGGASQRPDISVGGASRE